MDWEEKGTVTRGKSTLFEIVAVHVAGPPSISTSYVTALKRDDNGKLQLNLWEHTNITGNALESAGQVVLGRIGNDLDLGWFSNYDESSSLDRRIVVAMIDGRGELRIILWNLSFAENTQQLYLSDNNRLGDNVKSGFRTGQTKGVSLVILSDTRIVTAIKTEFHTLKIIVWNISSDGMTVERQGSWTSAGTADLIRVSSLGGDRIIVAFQNEQENLEVMVFDVNNQGELTKRSEATRGRIQKLAQGGLVSVMRDDDNKLRLIRWQVNNAGEISYDTDNFVEGHPTGIAYDVTFSSGFTAIEDKQHKLRFIQWDLGQGLSRQGSGVSSYNIKGSVKIALGFGYEGLATAALADDDTLRITIWQEE